MEYSTSAADVRFGPLEPLQSCIVGLLPGWSD
jgi:hypothetical protein